MSDFKQAIEWLKEGKKVRRKKWKSNIICGISDSVWDGKEHKRGIYFYDKDKIHITINLKFSLKDFEATDWEIFEEKKESLSDKYSEYYNGFQLKDIKEKIQNAHRRIYEVINMEWGKGMEYVLSEVREIFKEEFGDKLI